MIPQLIISVRELYDRDLRHCWQGIDTGFGVLSQPVSSENTVGSAIAFAGGARAGTGTGDGGRGVLTQSAGRWCRVCVGTLPGNGKEIL
jgi:hypothetical protein